MENLSALVKSLSAGERTLIGHFYKLRDFGEYRKRVKLFNLLLSVKVKTEKDLAQAVGYTAPNASYHNLKSRLKSDIICMLLMQEPAAKFNTPYAQAVFNCRRSILTGEILLNRGVYDEGINLLKKASRLAEKFELFAEQIIAEDTMRGHLAASNESQEVISATKNIERHYRKLGKIIQSKKNMYDSVFSGINGASLGEISNEENTNDIPASTGNDSDSTRVSFYNRLSKVNVLTNLGEFHKALDCASELLTIAETNPIVMSKSNQAGIHLEIATLQLHCSNYPKAIHHAESARSMFKIGMVNHVKASTILFYAQVHSKMPDDAAVTLKEILNSSCFKDRSFSKLQQRIQLLTAWFQFTNGEIKESAVTLKACAALSKEKSVWAEGYSLLECMFLIEKRSFDTALYKLEALRKGISRRCTVETQYLRVTAIINVLKQLIRNNGDHQTILEKKCCHFEKLKTGDDNCEWDPVGFEVIRFDEWIQTRALQKAG